MGNNLKTLLKHYKNWFYSIIVMFIIFLISSIPGDVINNNGLGNNNLHISGHSLLFFILCFSFYKSTKDVGKSIIFSVFYGLLDEIHQKYTPLRSSSMFDLYTDTIGAVFAGIILWKSHLILPKKLNNWLKK